MGAFLLPMIYCFQHSYKGSAQTQATRSSPGLRSK